MNNFISFILYSVPPAIVARQEAVYASLGQKVVLECISESHPNSINYWLDPSGKKIGEGAFQLKFVKNYVFNDMFI